VTNPNPSFHGETPEPTPIVMLQLTPDELHLLHHCMAYWQATTVDDTISQIRVVISINRNPILHDTKAYDALVEKLNSYALTTFPEKDFRFYDPSGKRKS
jgi:hypothetical protein